VEVLGESRAFEESYYVLPRQRLAIDGGDGNPWVFAQPNLFISHLHMDHALQISRYVVNRQKMGDGRGRIFFDLRLIREIQGIIQAWQRAERRKDPVELIPLHPLERIPLEGNFFLIPVPVPHTLPAMGFILERKRSVVKPEFRDRTPKQISELIQRGEKPTEDVFEPVFGYCGDMEIKGLDEYPEFYRTRILILECTFVLAFHPERIRPEGHIVWEEILERADLFQNEYLILTHFSRRYAPSTLFRHLNLTAPPSLRKRLRPWIALDF
jgi:ribonuclease Z